MYKPNATFVRGPNDYVCDRAALRDGLGQFLALKGHLSMGMRDATQ